MSNERSDSRMARAPGLILLLALLGAGLGGYGLLGFHAVLAEAREERAQVAALQAEFRRAGAAFQEVVRAGRRELEQVLSGETLDEQPSGWADQLAQAAEDLAPVGEEPGGSPQAVRLACQTLLATHLAALHWREDVRRGVEDRPGRLERRAELLRGSADIELLQLQDALEEHFGAAGDQLRTLALHCEQKLDQAWNRAELFGLSAWLAFLVLAFLVGRWLRDQEGRLEAGARAAEASAEQIGAAGAARSRFLADVGQELRTPLQGLLGMNARLLDTELDPEQREVARNLQACTESTLALVDDLLDFTALDAGRIRVRSERFHLRMVVEDLVDLLGERADAKGIDLVSQVHADLPQQLEGDPLRLRQVLVHLVSHALDVTERGSVVLRALPAGADANGGAQVRFEVVDTGPGMTKEAREALLQPVTQAGGAPARPGGGASLGLALCRRLASALGGSLSWESEPERGSTFALILPLRSTGATAAPSAGRFTGSRALILAPEGSLAQVLELELEEWGFQVDRTAELESARAQRGSGSWDLVVADSRVCGEDAAELAAATARKGAKPPALVLLTSPGERALRSRCRASGAKCLLKPLRTSELHDTLQGLVPAGPAAALPKRTTRRATPATSGAAKARVLIVEDNSINQRIARRMLESLGWEVDVAADGREALARHAERTYELILMDCQMPGMDGFEAAREIRIREQGLRRTPIVALTADTAPEDRAACTAAGMDGFLEKPVKLATFAALAKEMDLVPAVPAAERAGADEPRDPPAQ